MFVWTAFVALGLAALKYPFAWVVVVVNTAVVASVVFALVSALASVGSRRLFWAAYAASGVVVLVISPAEISTFLPDDLANIMCRAMIPQDIPVERLGYGFELDATQNWMLIADRLSVVVGSTAAAYIIPWLVQWGQKPPQP